MTTAAATTRSSSTSLPRPPVTRSSIAEAALRILDRAPDESSLTMRALAAELDVRAPSLYAHVTGIDDVIDLVHARINATIDLTPLAAADPIDGLRRFAHSYRRAYAAHRVAATVIISRSLNAHHALVVYEAAASCLLRAGVPSGQVMPLLAFLDAIALGSAIEPFAAGFTGSIGDYRREYPAIAESLSHSRRRRIDDEGFEVGLRSFLAAVALHAAPTDRA